jgi:hypothetical protein
MIKQEQGESIRSYIKRFFDTRATIPNVADDDVIDYFRAASPSSHYTATLGVIDPKWW